MGKGSKTTYSPYSAASQAAAVKAATAKAKTAAVAAEKKRAAAAAAAKKKVYNQDANANLKEAVIRGNEENTRTINRFEGTARGLANQFNSGSQNLNNNMNRDMNNANNAYQGRMRELMGQMGTASEDTHGRLKGQAYAGLDSGFAEAGDSLQASLAARGLSGSGVMAKSLGDLGQERMRQGSQANVTAYNQAIAQDDNTRNTQMSGEGNLYGATQANLQGAYGRNMGQLGQNYGNNMGIEGQIMQNQLNNTQQRQANLMGYAQLGRGMSGMSQNYLGQAGSGYQNIGQIAGSSAAQQGSLNNNFNSTMQQANSQQQAGKGSAVGSAVGAAAMFSDERLKENVEKVGEIDGFNIYTWDWNEAARGLTDEEPRFGVIAQEIQETRPEAVVTDIGTGYLKVNYPMLFAGGVA